MLRSRIAPTPSGFLHIGNLFGFVKTWLTVKQQHGQLLLRIDDIDNERSRPEYLQNIFEWLQALGLTCDEGPADSTDFTLHWSQQLRLPLYNQTLERLVATGKVYACNCSRKKTAANSSDGRYNDECRGKQIPLDAKDVVWRLQTEKDELLTWDDELMGPSAFSPHDLMGDFVIRRRNGLPSYQVASLTDDIHYSINYIVRGEDLLASTAAQLYMAKLLHENAFMQTRFCHHPLLKNEQGEKLSKSAGRKIMDTKGEVKDVPAVLGTIAQLLWPGVSLPVFSSCNDLLQWSNHQSPNKELA